MCTYVQRTASRGFSALRQLRQIRQSVPTVTLQMLVVRLVLSRFDFGNGLLVGIPTYCSVCTWCCMHQHSSSIDWNAPTTLLIHLLVSLHWLRVPQRIQYKIAVLTYNILQDTAPRYLGPLDQVADDLLGRRHYALPAPAVCCCRRSGCLQTVVAPLTSLLREYEKYCPKTLFLRHNYQYSVDDSKPSSFSNRILILLSDCASGTLVVL